MLVSKVKSRKNKQSIPSLFIYSFAYPYMIWCNHIWGNNHMIKSEKACTYNNVFPRKGTHWSFVSSKLTIEYQCYKWLCCWYFVYVYRHGEIPNDSTDYFRCNNYIHRHRTWGSFDLNVHYGRLDIRKLSLKISGARLWNSLPGYVNETSRLVWFKQQLKLFDL